MTGLGVAATAIVNPARRTVSLRGRGVDVSAVAQRQGGGGHARAAAFSFRDGELEKELERFEAGLEELLAGP
jgi:nanoRNase/pAp phosphatase (c-di-AMP/oligoRNAs hydrolase)